MSRAVWDNLLAETRAAYEGHPDLCAFAPFPDDVVAQDVQAFSPPCAGYLARETGLHSDQYGGFRDAIVAAGPLATWRETYKGTDIGQDFMDRFGCYCIIGAGGAFQSAQLWAWIVYMPAHLHYPWHHHPAEEMYTVLAGEAQFMRDGAPNETLVPGQTSFHASNERHAMETHTHPVLALVVWRNGFDTPPVLSDETS